MITIQVSHKYQRGADNGSQQVKSYLREPKLYFHRLDRPQTFLPPILRVSSEIKRVIEELDP